MSSGKSSGKPSGNANTGKLKIAVSGFQGTGKTSLTKALSERYGLTVIKEDMMPITQAGRELNVAYFQGQRHLLPRLVKRFARTFLDWDAARSLEYEKHEGFIADRWQLDLLNSWLVIFGSGRENFDDVTSLLLESFKENSKAFDYLIFTPFQKPFADGVNEEGNKRRVTFALHLLNTSVMRGLVEEFAQTKVIHLPNEKMSVEERMAFIEAAIEEDLAKTAKPEALCA